ncbi:30S ribosomal protein S2 [candidate division KSB1 bacterium]|nr:30S ribosomal protein S2 [candidate division KSB1 bacterium]RQW06359.1 MAG: 30S ribosomal protein S2 [candidate division KSB1 bacterium]
MDVKIQDLLLAGCHFGHLTRRWNPKMKPFIFMERNGIHIIDLKKTLVSLNKACEAATEIVRKGGEILLIGTKKQAKDIIKVEAERCGMPHVTDRWLGGTLTNFITIKKSVKRLKNLEKKATDGTYDKLAKKEILQIEREKEKLHKVLGGIREMNHLPAAIFVVDAKKEVIAIREATRLNVPVFAITDTNSDPDPIDYVIPCNDDAFKAINLVVHALANAIIEGRKGLQQNEAVEEAVAIEAAVADEGEND